MEVLVEGQRPDGRLPESNYEVVSPEYFSALDVDLVAGRGFTDADRSGAPRVAIVNQALAERLQLDGEAVGSRLSFEGPSGPWWTVVGVAEDVHRFGLSEDPPPQVLVPWWQEPWFFMTFVVRTQGAPEPLFASLRRAVWEVDDDQAIAMLTTMDEMLSESMAQREFNAFLITVFGIAALLLTAVGLYGVMSYLATQRHHEIAIRLALGADRRAILGLMLRRGMLLLLSGVAAGLVIALLLARFIERLLFGITATDATTFAVVTAVVAVVAFTASFVPAYRSTRTDAALVLRQ